MMCMYVVTITNLLPGFVSSYDLPFMLYLIGMLLIGNYICNILNECYTLNWDGGSISNERVLRKIECHLPKSNI